MGGSSLIFRLGMVSWSHNHVGFWVRAGLGSRIAPISDEQWPAAVIEVKVGLVVLIHGVGVRRGRKMHEIRFTELEGIIHPRHQKPVCFGVSHMQDARPAKF